MALLHPRCFRIITLEVILFMCLIIITHTTKITGSQHYKDNVKRNSMDRLPSVEPQLIPCPDPEDIQPCTCEVIEVYGTTMNCSKVTSEDELRSIFSQEFPFTNFDGLVIEDNQNIRSLRKGDLGNSSFVYIYLHHCFGLTEIEEEALAGSYETLHGMDLQKASLTSIPDISHFTHLWYLDISHNDFTTFPDLISSNLESLYIDDHKIESVSEDILKGLPLLREFSFAYGNLSHVAAGTLLSNEHLHYVNLNSNFLTTLPKYTVELHEDPSTLFLARNHITHIPPGAFSGVTSAVDMRGNLLEELDEEVWRPTLEYPDFDALYLYDNPLGCGCDIAWLILNRTLLSRVPYGASCADGTFLEDLDPTYYEEEC